MENINLNGYIIIYNDINYHFIILSHIGNKVVTLSELGELGYFDISAFKLITLKEQLDIFNNKFSKYIDLPIHLKLNKIDNE